MSELSFSDSTVDLTEAATGVVLKTTYAKKRRAAATVVFFLNEHGSVFVGKAARLLRRRPYIDARPVAARPGPTPTNEPRDDSTRLAR